MLYDFLYVMREEPVYFPWRRKKEIEDSGEVNPDYERYKRSKLRDHSLASVIASAEEAADYYISVKTTMSRERQEKTFAIMNILLDKAKGVKDKILYNKKIFGLQKNTAEVDSKKLEHLGLENKTEEERAAFFLGAKQSGIHETIPHLSFFNRLVETFGFDELKTRLADVDWLDGSEDEDIFAQRILQHAHEVARVFPRVWSDSLKEQEAFLSEKYRGLSARDIYGNLLGYIDNHQYVVEVEELAKDTLRAMYPELEFIGDAELQDALEWKLYHRARSKIRKK